MPSEVRSTCICLIPAQEWNRNFARKLKTIELGAEFFCVAYTKSNKQYLPDKTLHSHDSKASLELSILALRPIVNFI